MKNFKLNFKSIVRSKARWLLTLIAILTLGVGQIWAGETKRNWDKDKTVFFDNSSTEWSQPYLRLGCGKDDGDWSSNYALTKVAGTKDFWYYTMGAKFENYAAFQIVNNTGDGYNIYWEGNTHAWTKSTEYQKYNVTANFTLSATDGGSTYCSTTKTSGRKSYTVSYSTSGTGSGTLSVTKYNGSTYDAFSSGSSVDPTQIMKIVATPDPGNARTAFSVSGATQIGSTDTYYVTANTTISATFTPEETHNVTVYYKCGSDEIETSSTESAVGVSTTRSVTAPTLDDYVFSSWSLGAGVTSANTGTNPIVINTVASGSGFTLTANYTRKTCKLYEANGPKSGSSTDQGAMNYSLSEKAYYKDVTASVDGKYYFRFYHNGSTEYSSAWVGDYASGERVYPNGAKVTCNTSVGGWDDRPAMYFDGVASSSIRIWFDFHNKKAWITETKYAVTVNNGDHGTVSPNGSVSVGPNSGKSITATPATGWKFASWGNTGSAVLSSTSTNPTTVTATAAGGTVTPTYSHRYVLRGSQNADGNPAGGMAGWGADDNSSYTSASISDGVLTITANLTSASTQYKFMIRDTKDNAYKGQTGSGSMGDGDTWTLNGTNDVYFTTTAAGPYTFTYNTSTGSMRIDYPTSCTVNFSRTPSAAADAPTAATTVGSTSVTSGGSVVSGTSVTFTAKSENTGYSWEGWYTTSNTSGTQISTNKTCSLTVNKDTTIYAVYSENDYTVSVIAGEGGDVASDNVTAHKDTKVTLPAATPRSGYYFNGWEVTEGTAALTSSSSANAAQINGVTSNNTVTVRANFHPDDKIYFDNTYTKWSKVYVYLFNNNVWYENKEGDDGPGVKPNHSNRIVYGEMTKVAGTDNLYEYAYHTSSQDKSSFSHVAFSKDDQNNYNAFHQTEAAYRSDWCSTLPVYVATAGYDSPETNQTKYHSGGYWRAYNPKAGDNVYYYLDIFSGSCTPSQSAFEFQASGDGSLVAETSVKLNTASSNYTIGVHSNACGADQHYAMGTTITNDNSDSYYKLYKYNSSWNITLTTTSAGTYTFVLSQEFDSLRLSVIYPTSVGDYRLTYSYDSPAKTRSSDVIKKKVAESGDVVHTSMYVDPTNTYSQLVLERCSVITAGAPVWETRKTFDHTYVTNNFKQNSVATKDVYEMDLSITGTNGDASTLSNIQKYDGPFYIKTNCADGGWADYTKNVMDQNTINFSTADSKTFDYYFIKYVNEARKKYGTYGWDACDLFDNAGTPTNLRCVIANKYNNSISDTLKTDAVISGGNNYETLPKPGSVRFSYNSYTNEVKRTYLNGSTCWNDAYLLLTADQAIKTLAGESIAGNATSFDDKNDWMYEKKLKVPETTKIWLKATFNETAQDLIGTSASKQTLIGGSSTSNYQTIRIVYDFKTNHIMAAWEPEQSEYDGGAAIDLSSDVLLIHNRRTTTAAAAAAGYASADCLIDSVTMIDITKDNTSFKNIGKVYSAFRFQKTDANGILGLDGTPANSAASYYRYNYWISFPYDVKMTDIFGINGYGSTWRIQYYDGAERASKGWYKGDGTSTFWKTMPMSDDAKLNKGEGYVLQLSPSAFRSSTMWQNSATERYLYFPSGDNLNTIQYATSSVTLTPLPCTKGAFTDGTGKNHDITDSHWHVFGIPTFFEATGTKGTGHNYYDEDEEIVEDNDISDHEISNTNFYFYKYNNNGSTYNTFTVTSSSGFTFQPMHAYMIQMTGTLNFEKNAVPASVAARRAAEKANYNIQVELQSEDIVRDQTFVTLRDSAEVGFAFNEDLMKIHNDGKTNIYSYAGPYDVAANILPIENRTIALGVEAASNGAYTFHMPSNFSGTVTLVDMYAQTRTNLALEDYEVTLEKGTYEGRFYLELDINKVTTDVVTVSGDRLEESGIRKFIYDNRLYIMKNGIIYDARGNRVK